MNKTQLKHISFALLISYLSLYSPCVSAQSRNSQTATRRTSSSSTTSTRTPKPSKPTPPPPVVKPKMSSSQIKQMDRQRNFTHYSNLAYNALNKNQYALFLRYSDYALQTGNYTARLYYDRGYVYEVIGDYNAARKEYKKADRLGYMPARYALRELEINMLRWR